jgi:fumarylacetoacetase
VTLDPTNHPDLRSWVRSANEPSSDFPIQNLPFGVFKRAAPAERPRIGVAIGDQIVDVAACAEAGLLTADAARAADRCREPELNGLFELASDATRALRHALSGLLRSGSPHFERDQAIATRILVPMREAELSLPARIGDYTDFYASIDHATNVGSMFRPDNPLLPNYKWIPIGYHGRSSSIVVSGTDVRRPVGQSRDASDGMPTVGASRRLDYELEVGAFIATGNSLGSPIALDDAERHVFGLCLVNDWSARDIQAWEYQPLGPFLAKNFATTVSPWVVTLEALAPFRAGWSRPAGEPPPLAYLDDGALREAGAIDIQLEVWLDSARMRAANLGPQRLSHASFRDSWWTVAQMLAHHTVNGCNLNAGDLFGSGTQSGPLPTQGGSLLELSGGGRQPVALAGGETRTFLEDGDRVTLRGWCERQGFARIGFGEAVGTVLPA